MARGEGNIGVGDQEVQTTMYKINKLHGYIVQYREYNQYFIITKWSIACKNYNYVVYLKLFCCCCLIYLFIYLFIYLCCVGSSLLRVGFL